jgi:hypothetical protein
VTESRFIVRRGTRETSGTEKEGVERVPRLVTGREVPSAVRKERGKTRERREDKKKSQKSYRKKLQNPRPTKKYLTVETVAAQCGKQQSQNQQCLSRKKSPR